MICPKENCRSMNVQSLSHYWASLPSDSPLKVEYAQPAAVSIQFVGVAVVAILGIALLSSGEWFGLLVLLGAGLWGAAGFRQASAAETARSAWGSALICLVCTGTFRA